MSFDPLLELEQFVGDLERPVEVEGLAKVLLEFSESDGISNSKSIAVLRVNNEDILRSPQVAVDGDLCDTYIPQSQSEVTSLPLLKSVNGSWTSVEKSFGYNLNKAGNLFGVFGQCLNCIHSMLLMEAALTLTLRLSQLFHVSSAPSFNLTLTKRHILFDFRALA